MSEQRIACPRCRWEPRAEDNWWCECNHVWNTFDTGGRCPQCHRQWEDTQCLSCGEWSPHLDWYLDLDEQLADSLAEVEEALKIGS